MAQATRTVHVTRYRPEHGAGPYIQSYQVPLWEGMMVLDALTYVSAELDPTLAFRWSCRMGICGSCGMTVNGRPRLTCQEPMDSYRGRTLILTPLENFPVIRDLVVDITNFTEKLPRVKPWLIRAQEKPLTEGEYLQTPEKRSAYAEHSACINCLLCYAACPVYGLEPAFLGPAALALARRYNLDSRDEGAGQRRPAIAGPEGVWECTFVGECSVVCPKGVLPAQAIQQTKAESAAHWAFSTLLPWSKR